MAIQIQLNESNASRRNVPIWCVQSNGTSAATNESGNSFLFSQGGVFYGSGGSISAISALAGLYMCNFKDSRLSVMGPGLVHYSSTTALTTATPFMVVADAPYGGFLASTPKVAAGGTASTATLASTETTKDSWHNGNFIVFQFPNGDVAGNIISAYTGSTQVATLQNSMATAPNSKTSYIIYPGTTATDLGTVWDAPYSTHTTAGSFGQATAPVQSGTAQGGTTSNISLAATASATTSYYANDVIVLTGGSGAGQAALISVYSGAIRSAVPSTAFVTAPDNTTQYVILPFGSVPGASVPTAASIASQVWEELRASHTQAGSYGQYVLSQQTGTSAGTILGVQSVQTVLAPASTFSVLLQATTHSGATIAWVSNVGSVSTVSAMASTGSVILAPGTHSGVTIAWVNNVGSVSTVSAMASTGSVILAPGTHSGATVAGVSNVAGVAVAGRTAIAASFLSYDVGNSRILQEYFWPLRNKVVVGVSVATIFKPDDTTSSWTGTISTSTVAIAGIDPLG